MGQQPAGLQYFAKAAAQSHAVVADIYVDAQHDDFHIVLYVDNALTAVGNHFVDWGVCC